MTSRLWADSGNAGADHALVVVAAAVLLALAVTYLRGDLGVVRQTRPAPPWWRWSS